MGVVYACIFLSPCVYIFSVHTCTETPKPHVHLHTQTYINKSMQLPAPRDGDRDAPQVLHPRLLAGGRRDGRVPEGDYIYMYVCVCTHIRISTYAQFIHSSPTQPTTQMPRPDGLADELGLKVRPRLKISLSLSLYIYVCVCAYEFILCICVDLCLSPCKYPHPSLPKTHNHHNNHKIQVLDEPAPRQSDPSILELQLRGLSRRRARGEATVRM